MRSHDESPTRGGEQTPAARKPHVTLTKALLQKLNDSGMTQREAAALTGKTQPAISTACDVHGVRWNRRVRKSKKEAKQ